MSRTVFAAALLAAVFWAGWTPAAAQDRSLNRDRDIYGFQLMTPQERDAYRARMRSARTQEERERIRAENHARMQERAKERGVTLPDAPGGRGIGRGPGPGPGPGGGMGPGRGRP